MPNLFGKFVGLLNIHVTSLYILVEEGHIEKG